MAHIAAWYEKNRHNGTVKLVCSVCGKHVSGQEKQYDAGTWAPPYEH